MVAGVNEPNHTAQPVTSTSSNKVQKMNMKITDVARLPALVALLTAISDLHPHPEYVVKQ